MKTVYLDVKSAVIMILALTVQLSTAVDQEKLKGSSIIQLNMAPDSIDDPFEGCQEETYKLIMKKYFDKEMSLNKNLQEAWTKFEDTKDYYERALQVYSDKDNGIYFALNQAMRTGRKDYMTKFNFVTLHFLITCGIQRRLQNSCRLTYRRTNLNFETDVVGKEMRFGSFTSSSTRSDLVSFGRMSCFQMKTCLGADISKLSHFPEEKEVLIPPYEKFKITKVEKDKVGCNVMYMLESTGTFSNMKGYLVKTLKTISKFSG